MINRLKQIEGSIKESVSIKAKEEIEKILEDHGAKTDIDAIALTSKDGVPVASYVEKEKEHESFSTLSATILGAGEVIFSGFEKKKPDLFIGESKESVLLIKSIDTDMALSLLADSDKEEEMKRDMDEIASKIREISETFEIGGI